MSGVGTAVTVNPEVTMHSRGRLGETGLLGDRHQVLKLVQFHNCRFCQ
jgi:hypothetical protein